jgi:hypothetical protein
MLGRAFLAIALVLLGTSPARAQEESTLALVGSFTPEWKSPVQFQEVLGNAGLYEAFFQGTPYASGTDVSIGVGLGRQCGGDWSVRSE